MSPARARPPSWVLPALILTLAATLRLANLGAENLWIDEIFSLGQAGPPLEQIANFWDLDKRGSTRPLSLVLLHWIRGLGSSEALARLPYALVGILDVAILYLVARELVHRRTALTAALFLALTPIHVWYSQEVRWYAQWSLLTTISFWALVKAWKTDRTGWWLAYVGAAALNLYTFVVTLHVLVAQALTAWFLPDRGRRWAFRGKALASLAMVAVLALPAVMHTLGMGGGAGSGGGRVGTPRPSSLAALPYTFFAFVAGFTVGPTVAELHDLPAAGTLLRKYPEVLLFLAAFAPLFLIGLWALRTRGDLAAVVLPWALGLPVLVFGSSVLSGQTYNVRYAYPAVPGAALLLAVGVQSLGRLRVPAMALVMMLFGFSLFNYYLVPAYDKEHMREAMAFVRERGNVEDPVVIVGQGLAAAEYYGQSLAVEPLRGCRVEPRGGAGGTAVRPEDLRDDPDMWLVVSRDWGKEALECRRALAATHDVVARRAFVGVDVYRLRRR
ncbi:MAG TPA: glycosyltransferase family 39 protein [Gemmatimonadota bacterium]|nr:glycosyltransferase family 39 protein [Gemmatimonadota bacterium]